MADPYKFGAPPEESQLSRTAKLLGGMMQQSLATKKAKMDAERELELRKFKNSELDAFNTVISDPNSTSEQIAMEALRRGSNVNKIGDYETSKYMHNTAQTLLSQKKDKVSSNDVYLGTRPLKGGGRGLHYGIPSNPTLGTPEVVHKVDQLTDYHPPVGGGGKTDEELKAAGMIKEQSAIAEQAGADLTALGKNEFISGYDNNKNPIKMKSYDTQTKTWTPEGLAMKTQMEAKLNGAKNQINQIQGIMSDKYGWGITVNGKTVTPAGARKVNYGTKPNATVSTSYNIKGKDYTLDELKNLGYTEEQVAQYKKQ